MKAKNKHMAGPDLTPAKATFTFERVIDGRVSIDAKNTGFNHLELVGLLQLAIESTKESGYDLADEIGGSKL